MPSRPEQPKPPASLEEVGVRIVPNGYEPLPGEAVIRLEHTQDGQIRSTVVRHPDDVAKSERLTRAAQLRVRAGQLEELGLGFMREGETQDAHWCQTRADRLRDEADRIEREEA